MLDAVRINEAPIRQVDRGPTLNDILLKLNNAQYVSLIDVSSGYHNLKLDEKSSYFTTFADKGVTMVIVDRQDYINNSNNLLNQSTYRAIPLHPTNTIKTN